MNSDHDENRGGGDDDLLEDHEAELAARDAEEELREEISRVSQREYQKLAADLRWEVLAYVEAHPDKTVDEVAEFFGIKEGSIRAWKAHLTMGTYKRKGEAVGLGGGGRRGKQPGLFRENREVKHQGFLERKRYSNFIHYFDKTPPGIICPHFYILAHANGCPFACDYCYLRLTLRHYPEPTIFTNTARLFQELRDWLLSTEEPSVMNAGELSDSLAWDLHTCLSTNLASLFASQARHKLLFVTKSTAVENLLAMEPNPRIVMSFSVNASEVSSRYERGAPSPADRIASALKLKSAGWEVRIRLDPLVPIDGWKDHYEEIIKRINELEPSVVTIGSLRYFKNLISHASETTDVFKYGHDHGDPDGRLRIPRDTRLEMYKFCIDRLSCLRIGLCKETASIHEALGLPGRHQSCNCTIE